MLFIIISGIHLLISTNYYVRELTSPGCLYLRNCGCGETLCMNGNLVTCKISTQLPLKLSKDNNKHFHIPYAVYLQDDKTNQKQKPLEVTQPLPLFSDVCPRTTYRINQHLFM